MRREFVSSQQGYSLLELALVLVITGLVTALTLGLITQVSSRSAEQFDRDLLRQADEAVLGFVFLYDRLPCPDTSGDGLENCGHTSGQLPQNTLGIALRGGQTLRYSVYRGSGDLSVASNRFDPYLPSPMETEFSSARPGYAAVDLGNVTGVDLCAKLVSQSGSGSAAAHVLANGSVENVAYALAAPGVWDSDASGNLFDADNVAGSGFVSPQRAMDLAYDDRVRAVNFRMLWDRLGCGGVMSAAGHAQPNATVAMSMLLRAMIEYREVLDIKADIVAAGIASATASTVMASAGLTKSTGTIALVTANVLVSQGTLSPILAPAVISVVANTAAVASAAAALAAVVAEEAAIDALVEEADDLIDEFDEIYRAMRQRSIDLDEHGLYLN